MTTKIFISQWVAEPDTMTLSNMGKLYTQPLCTHARTRAHVCIRACAQLMVFVLILLSVCAQ